MKKVGLSILLVLSTMWCFAQESASTTQQTTNPVEVKTISGPDKQSVSLFVINYSYPAADIQGAVISRLEKEGVKGKKVKNGFYAYKGVKYNYLWKRTFDFYLAFPGSEKAGSIYLLCSMGYDNYFDVTNAEVLQDVTKWLNSLEEDIKGYIHQNNISAEEKELKSAEKELDKLKKQKSKVEKDLDKVNSNIKTLEASRLIPDGKNLPTDTKLMEKEKKQAEKLSSQQSRLEYSLDEVNQQIQSAEQAVNQHENNLRQMKAKKY